MRRMGGIGWARVGLALLLAGCNADMGVGGEGTGSWVAGRLDGFGSVVVAGQAYDDRDAEVLLEIDPRAPLRLPITALRLGMVASLSTGMAGGPVTVLRVAPILRAPITDLDPASRHFVAGGQTVRFDASPAEFTALDGWRQASDLREGDAVEVHGERDAQGVIRASLLVRLPDATGVRIQGPARPLDAPRGIWSIGAQRVDLRGAEMLPAGRAVQPGDPIVAFASGELGADGVLVAEAVAILPPAGPPLGLQPDGAPVRLSGLLTAGTAGGLTLLGQGLDLQAAVVEGGSLADVQSGRRVVVQGQAVPSGIRVRTLALVDPAAAPEVTVTAAVGNFAGTGGFALRGHAVDGSGAALTGLSADNLVNGQPVRARGAWRGSALTARSVEAVPVAEGDAVVHAGVVVAYDPSSGRFRLAGLDRPLRLLPGSRFAGLRPGDFRDGAAVVVRGTVRSGEALVEGVQPRVAGPEPAVVEFSGRAGNVERVGPGGEFEIGATDFVWTATTVFRGPGGGAADLLEGAVVRVRAVRDGAVWRATEVDARSTQAGNVRLRGTVTQWQPPLAMRLDGQRVDVSGARFDPPSLRDQLAGAEVEVDGVLVDGIIRATLVRDP